MSEGPADKAAPDIEVLFFDVGGVLLTNGWDRRSRRGAMEKFGLDWEEYRDRHDLVAADFEMGRLTLDDYLERTVFYRERPFEQTEFADFMLAQSEPFPRTLAIVEELAESGRYMLATLNNESREINEHRIERFGLDKYFSVFLSSCYLGVRKPEPEIFKLAIDITQRSPEQCLFVDDRALNLECAVRAGINAIHYESPEQLTGALRRHGVTS